MGYYVKELPENCAKCDCLRECGDFDTYVTKFCGMTFELKIWIDGMDF